MSRLWTVLCVALVGAVGCNSLSDVVHGLDEFEANEILVVLEAKSISASKVKEEGRVVAYTVQVRESSVADAMRFLVANKLPRRRAQGLSEVYPVGGGGLIPTKSEEKAKFLMAIQGEIERKLSRLPGVVSAHVSVVIPDKDVIRDLNAAPPIPTASVAIVYNGQDERGSAAISEAEIQKLVAASVEDLKITNVAVVMKRNEPARLVNSAASGDSADGVITARDVLGIRVADENAANRIKLMLAVFSIVAVLGLAVGIGGIVRSLTLQRKTTKLEGDLSSVRKAGRSTQTGMQPPAA
jgi:type III secretion protein J